MAKITMCDSLPTDPIFTEGPQSFFPRLGRRKPPMPTKDMTLEEADAAIIAELRKRGLCPIDQLTTEAQFPRIYLCARFASWHNLE